MIKDKQLTKNFKLSEFIESKFFDTETQARVKMLYFETQSVQDNIQILANQLQNLRDYLCMLQGRDVIIKVNIAYRPVFYEHAKGRSGKSKHTLGMAGDITAQGLTPKYVAAKIEELIEVGEMIEGGLSAYRTFVHYDTRIEKARW